MTIIMIENLANGALIAIEVVAAVFGVLGTVLLARNGERAGFGFVLYLVSNAAWITFGWLQRDWAILGQNLAFLASSLLGIWTWLIAPRRMMFSSVYRAIRPYRSAFVAARVAWRCSR